MQADYSNFVFYFPKFRYHENRGWSEINFFCVVKFADPEQIVFDQESRMRLLYTQSYGKFSVKISKVLLPWQQQSV